ncbi:glycine betaine ABC transporter substrate-binding protein [Alicyclobacillus fodiniaquatilis]|uniref:Glycine betaine ABC transporter substrate-binding protein n=1 Tax=Alicyclobacillus fodiniaquatilis TaxID=1661150 RepID=A0ABW4JHC5_9BACL
MQIKKIGLSIGSIAAVLGLVAGCGTGNNSSGGSSSSSKTVDIGYITWDEDVAVSYLWQNILESKGYTVKLDQLQAGPLFTGLSQNNVNLFFDTWLPDTHKAYMQKYGANLESLGKWYQGKTTEGIVVPTYMTNVNSISDLNKISGELGGQIVGIEPGAGETSLAQNAIKDYGLKETLQSSSTPAMLAALKKAYDAKKPIAVLLWSPHWAFATYKLKYLKDPKQAFGKAGWIQTEANKTWAQANPKVAGWIKNFKLTDQQLGQLENDINQADNQADGVKKWVAANQQLVNSWTKS